MGRGSAMGQAGPPAGVQGRGDLTDRTPRAPCRGAKPLQRSLHGDVGRARSSCLRTAPARQKTQEKHNREAQGQGDHRRTHSRYCPGIGDAPAPTHPPTLHGFFSAVTLPGLCPSARRAVRTLGGSCGAKAALGQVPLSIGDLPSHGSPALTPCEGCVEGTWLGLGQCPDTSLPPQSGSFTRSGRNAGTSKVSVGQCQAPGLGHILLPRGQGQCGGSLPGQAPILAVELGSRGGSEGQGGPEDRLVHPSAWLAAGTATAVTVDCPGVGGDPWDAAQGWGHQHRKG